MSKIIDGIYFVNLDKLTPTLHSTLYKTVEESGELSREILAFLPYINLSPLEISQNNHAADILNNISEELLDVAQTCVTMLFVLEDKHNINTESLLKKHLLKLKNKGYLFCEEQDIRFDTSAVGRVRFKYMTLPRLEIEGVDLLRTVCKIQEETGELTQFLGKKSGASGEVNKLVMEDTLEGAALELLDIAQCCVTMMYILTEKYNVDIPVLIKKHIDKLKTRGYCS